MQTVEEANAHTIDGDKIGHDGDISINASGRAEILYGNMGDGRVTTAGDFTVSGGESVYIDSDLHIGKDLNLSSDGEIVLDLSNMGNISKENLHKNFLDHFKQVGTINVRDEGADGFMIALDMWEEADPESGKAAGFNLNKYDVSEEDYDGASDHKLAEDIKDLTISLNDEELDDNGAQAHTYIWVDGAEQLNGIQAYKNANEASKILTYNFALKNDIDASALTDYEEIGGTTGYSGTFDGRGFRIIGLNANLNEDGTEHEENDAHSRAESSAQSAMKAKSETSASTPPNSQAKPRPERLPASTKAK